MYYYRVKAKDIYNQYSAGSMIVNAGSDVIIVSDESDAHLTFDDQSKNFLYSGGNGYNSDIRITVKKETALTGSMLSVHNVRAYDASGTEIKDLLIPNTRLGPVLSISYGEAGASVIAKAGAQNAQSPSLYWFNSVKWVKLGGSIDSANGEISLRTRVLGRYAVMLSNAPDKFSVNGVEPRIFSPGESNQVISKIHFYIDNPNNSEINTNIFDINGRIIRTGLPRDQESSIYWDGRDTEGKIVPSGIYIYQIESEDKTINGTIVVAK